MCPYYCNSVKISVEKMTDRCGALLVAVLVGTYARAVTAGLQLNARPNDPFPPSSTNANLQNVAVTGRSQYRLVVEELSRRLQELQVKEDKPYRFPLSWQQDKGLYPSEIRFNFAGDPNLEMVRDTLTVSDNNMFATAWTTICLLETRLYADAPKPSEAQLSLALEAIARYHDRNLGYNSSIMNFWPQVYNETTKTWMSTPTNLLQAFHFFDIVPAKTIEEILKLLGLTDIERFIEQIISMRSSFERAFQLPPDFDDSFVNIGLGALLKELGSDLPAATAQWAAANTNITSVTDALKRYAYRPFSSDKNANTIDTRTFYYMRYYLGSAAATGQDVALVPTWIQNLDEARKGYYKGVAMPFQMNNVDVTVAANTIYGLTSAILSGLLPVALLDDSLIRQVYLNTSAMIVTQISHHLYERPDLELTYYPSVIEFYWFVARTLSKMESALLHAPLPLAMQEVYSSLKPVLEISMTLDVLKKVQRQGDNWVFFDDFLGDGDINRKNKTVVKGEDRLFTTSVAVNALVTTWTVFDPATRTNHWKPGTPLEVRDTVNKSCAFLSAFILRDTYKPWNVFFSGSVKGKTTMPFAYPSNRMEFLNGTAFHDDSHWPRTNEPFFIGVQGLIAENEYQALLNKTHFGSHSPLNFTTYNEPGNYFPFWSSSPYTYANTMLALARYDNIVG